MRKAAVACAWIALILILGLSYLAAGGSIVRTEGDTELQIGVLQTKEDADCIVMYRGTDAVMIDTGEAQDSESIIRKLQEMGIEKLDLLILTHPDKDHIGGAISILRKIPADKVICPYYDGKKEEWEAVKAYCVEKKIEVYSPTHVWKTNTGYVNLLVYPPQEKHYKKDNNYSLAVLAEHGNVKMFFGGDSLRKRSEELLAMNLPEVALYKVACHGRANSASADLIETLNPVYAVVTSDCADEEIVKSCEKCGSSLLFSRDADVKFKSDGKQLTREVSFQDMDE